MEGATEAQFLECKQGGCGLARWFCEGLRGKRGGQAIQKHSGGWSGDDLQGAASVHWVLRCDDGSGAAGEQLVYFECSRHGRLRSGAGYGNCTDGCGIPDGVGQSFAAQEGYCEACIEGISGGG